MKEVAFFLLSDEFHETLESVVRDDIERQVMQWIFDNLGIEAHPMIPAYNNGMGTWHCGFGTDEPYHDDAIFLVLVGTKCLRGDSYIVKYKIERARPLTSSLLRQVRREYGPHK